MSESEDVAKLLQRVDSELKSPLGGVAQLGRSGSEWSA